MNDSKITSEKFIALSREYVDDVMEDRKIKVRKEHYYIFAISNFIATKEHFLKKNIRRKECIFNRIDNINVLPMIVEFYNSIKSKNKSFKEPSVQEIKKKIKIIPDGEYDDEEYLSLYMFQEIRNALSHAGNYYIKEKNGEYIVCITNDNSNIIDIPIELFDFIAFYINSYNNNTEVEEIFYNYLIYKQSKDNEKYYKYESKSAIDKIVDLLSKTQIRIKQKSNSLTKNRSGSNSEEYIEEVLAEFIYNYGEQSDEILDKLRKAKISKEEQLDFLLQFNIHNRANKRLANIKIEQCIENIKSMLKLDRKSASLYSHSVILFTNREEPSNTNAQEILSSVNKIKKEILSIKIDDIEQIDNAGRKKILVDYKQVMIKILEELPNLIRIDEHKYRNSIFHNNIKFENSRIHFWNQKDNTNSNDIHTFDIYQTPETYNSELKSIENYNMNVGEITIHELYNILSHYYKKDDVNELIGKIWNINLFDNELLKWNMSIYDLIDDINKKIKELSR